MDEKAEAWKYKFFAQVHTAGKWQKRGKDKVWLQTSFNTLMASSPVEFGEISVVIPEVSVTLTLNILEVSYLKLEKIIEL